MEYVIIVVMALVVVCLIYIITCRLYWSGRFAVYRLVDFSRRVKLRWGVPLSRNRSVDTNSSVQSDLSSDQDLNHNDTFGGL